MAGVYLLLRAPRARGRRADGAGRRDQAHRRRCCCRSRSPAGGRSAPGTGGATLLVGAAAAARAARRRSRSRVRHRPAAPALDRCRRSRARATGTASRASSRPELGLGSRSHHRARARRSCSSVVAAWLLRRVWRGELDWIDAAGWATVALLVTAELAAALVRGVADAARRACDRPAPVARRDRRRPASSRRSSCSATSRTARSFLGHVMDGDRDRRDGGDASTSAPEQDGCPRGSSC